MRPSRFAAAAAVVLMVAGLADIRPANAATTSIDLHADRVTYFSTLFTLTADGGVRLRLNDGTTISGQTFSMDLRLDRFVVAGDVHVDRGSVHLSGAAFSDFIDFNRYYFIPILTEPDRWTYLDGDLTTPLKGREMPGDAFALADTSRARPYVLATSAFVIPKENVQFTPARVATGPVYAPFPAYNLNFSSNPNFAQNAFAGATIDVPIPLEGTRHTLSAFHVRYDSINKLYGSIDQHFVWGPNYAVVSLNPATALEKQYNLLANFRLSPNVQIHDFTQFQNHQRGFSEPDASAHFSSVQLTVALRRSYIAATGNFYNNSLLGPPQFYAQNLHPTNVSLSWTGYETRVPGTPLRYLLQSGFTFANDAYGVGSFNGTPYNRLFAKYVQAQVYTPSIKVSNNIFVNATFSKNRQYFSLPHYIDTAQSTESLSFLPPRAKVAYVLAYSVTNTGDYAGNQQTLLYPASIPVALDGTPDYGFRAFRGFGTTRSLTASAVFTPTTNFTFNLIAQRNKDFPAPLPGVLGNPPYVVSADLRVRLARQLLLDISRAYYFNFGTLRYSPQFGIQFAP